MSSFLLVPVRDQHRKITILGRFEYIQPIFNHFKTHIRYFVIILREQFYINFGMKSAGEILR